MKKLLLLVVPALLALVAAVVLTGCSTPTTVCEFDKDGKLIKKTVTEKDAISKLTESTKNKTVIAWSDGWLAYVAVSMATTEDPTPTGKCSAGKLFRAYMSILEKQKNLKDIAEVIKAMKTNLSVTTSGINSSSADTKETAAETEKAPEEDKE